MYLNYTGTDKFVLPRMVHPKWYSQGLPELLPALTEYSIAIASASALRDLNRPPPVMHFGIRTQEVAPPRKEDRVSPDTPSEEKCRTCMSGERKQTEKRLQLANG